MDVNFEYYRIFYYVAKYRNFTKAAHALHNSQPNITRAMNCLEREIHCTCQEGEAAIKKDFYQKW